MFAVPSHERFKEHLLTTLEGTPTLAIHDAQCMWQSIEIVGDVGRMVMSCKGLQRSDKKLGMSTLQNLWVRLLHCSRTDDVILASIYNIV
jgi:hypothetical protein